MLFVVAMIPLTLLLRKESMGYAFGEDKRKINHLLFMDDLKLYGSSEAEVKDLCGVVQKFSDDIGMKFGLSKCAALVLKAGVQEKCEGIELPDGEVMHEVEDGGYKYLGVLQGADIMTKEMKEKVRKEYLRRVKLVAGSGLSAGNLLRAVNAWAVSVVRYSAGVITWTHKELKDMDVKTRKILTTNGVFHRRSNVDRLYMKRKVGGRGLISVEECVKSEEKGLDEYVLASDEWMLKVVAVAAEVKVSEPRLAYRKRMASERSDRLRTKNLHGKYFKETENAAPEKSWQWLCDGNTKKWTEGYVCAAQENVLMTRNYRVSILNQGGDRMCRLCGQHPETVGHLISACSKIVQTEYKRRHDKMGLRVYWELCGKYGLKRSENWWEEVPDAVRLRDDQKVEIWWDRKVHTDGPKLEHTKPDVVVVDRENGKWVIVEFAVPFDKNVVEKEKVKEGTYAELADRIRREHLVRVECVPIVVGALGAVTKDLVGWLRKLGVKDVVGCLQMSAIIATTAILRKVLRSDVGK